MPRKERWVTAKEALEILKRNSGRDDIPDSYVRTLVRDGKIESRPIDGRTKEYRFSDLNNYIVHRRDGSKGDTRAARAAGSRRKKTDETLCLFLWVKSRLGSQASFRRKRNAR